MRLQSLLAAGIAFSASLVAAHPGEDLSAELAERRAFLESIEHRNLDHCAEKLKARGIESRNIFRRAERVKQARRKRSIAKRDLEDVLNTDHNSTALGYDQSTPPDILFGGSNSCILTPDTIQGPYYVGGEYVRQDLTEDQEGVALALDYQVIDVATCEPVPDAYVEIWACNSTGVYGGVIASGNGNTADESNIDNTWLRGIQKTTEDGVAIFDTLFPGHYIGRTTHIHIMVHTNVTVFPNGTLGNEIYASHIGQVYFDQDLIYEVEELAPYTANTQQMTLNEDDFILADAADSTDPVMHWTQLGDTVAEGLFAWLAFGIDTSRSARIQPAVFYYEDGGVPNPDGGSGGSLAGGAPPDA